MNASLAALERYGLLMLADNDLPAHAQLVAGGPIKGSWWGHAEGKRIFNEGEALEAHPDVTTAKLINGKATFIHRRLWPALVAVGREPEPERESWRGLSGDAIGVLELVERVGNAVSDDPAIALIGKARTAAFKAVGDRLLAASFGEHTAKGTHRTVLVRWDDWAAKRGVTDVPTAQEARRILTEAARSLGPTARLPWEGRSR